VSGGDGAADEIDDPTCDDCGEYVDPDEFDSESGHCADCLAEAAAE
jgi:hypothetical protein